MPDLADDAQADDVCTTLAQLPTEVLQHLLLGGLHDAAIVDDLVAGRLSLAKALAAVAPIKHNLYWLAWLGLYPYRPDAPIVMAIEALLADGAAFQQSLSHLVATFWQEAFAATWAQLLPQFTRSVADMQLALANQSLSDFARQAGLLADLDENRQVLAALRGGYQVAFSQIGACTLLPSPSTTAGIGPPSIAHQGSMPSFPTPIPLPEIAGMISQAPVLAPGVDLPVIFKALGDPTQIRPRRPHRRFRPVRSSWPRRSEFCKPTISHHVSLLRLAGLLHEQQQQGQVLLSVRREVLETLSTQLLRQLALLNPIIHQEFTMPQSLIPISDQAVDAATYYYDGDYPSALFSRYPENCDAVTPFQGIAHDVDRYLALAAELDGPVLEICCGTGRVAIPLAAAGHAVTGVDRSAAQLAQCRQNLGRVSPAVAEHLQLVEQDSHHPRLAATRLRPDHPFQQPAVHS